MYGRSLVIGVIGVALCPATRRAAAGHVFSRLDHTAPEPATHAAILVIAVVLVRSTPEPMGLAQRAGGAADALGSVADPGMQGLRAQRYGGIHQLRARYRT